MILYQNITKEKVIVLSADIKMPSNKLLECFFNEINKSKVNVLGISKINKSQYKVELEINSKKIIFFSVIKNITGAGWINKPYIKRVQVSNLLFEDVTHSNTMSKEEFNVIFGLYCFDDNPIIVAWDAYRYYNHNTLRSCYVTIDSLLLGYKKGIYQGVDSSQKIWIFEGEQFDKFVDNYTNYVKEFYGHE